MELTVKGLAELLQEILEQENVFNAPMYIKFKPDSNMDGSKFFLWKDYNAEGKLISVCFKQE